MILNNKNHDWRETKSTRATYVAPYGFKGGPCSCKRGEGGTLVEENKDRLSIDSDSRKAFDKYLRNRCHHCTAILEGA